MLQDLKQENNEKVNEKETFQAIKSIKIEVDNTGSIRIIPDKINPDEITGLLLRVASNIKQQLNL